MWYRTNLLWQTHLPLRAAEPRSSCPKHIAIPDYFGLYNNMKRLKNTGYTANQKVYYANLAKTHGKATDCIRCGLCEKNCPQRLPIRALLETVSQAMESEDVQFHTAGK